MIEKVVIKDNKNSPIHYLPELENFSNGKEFIFKPGVNIIVGENGSGKTTLLRLIQRYLLVDKEECSIGIYNSVINALVGLKQKVPEGVDVYADYDKNIFKLCHASEKENDDAMSSFDAFGEFFTQKHASTGEGVSVALHSLFNRMFSPNAKLKFDYDKVGKRVESYGEYIEKHRTTEHDEWTVLMDEPDRNLSIDNIKQIKGILSFHKPQTQIIAVIHNPLIIYALADNKEINFIEMTPNYVHKVKQTINEIMHS